MNKVRQRVWNGTVNTKILFRDAEYLLQVNRNSYFPLYFTTIARFFAKLTGNDLSGQMWLEYENVPLKWNMPVGVLYDLLFLASDLPDQSCWTLVLRVESHNNEYPEDQIIPFKTKNGIDYVGSLTLVVINHLKQSCYVINGNSRAVMNLSEHDTKTLWSAMVQHDYGLYTSLMGKILPKTVQRVPIKLYLAGSATLIQAPVYPTIDNAPTTLLHVLQQWLPEAYESASAYIHGINVDVLYDEPVVDVWTTFRHLDNFLYMVVVANCETHLGARSGTS